MAGILLGGGILFQRFEPEANLSPGDELLIQAPLEVLDDLKSERAVGV